MKMMVHINRFELKKGVKGRPWTIHTSKGCISAKEVLIDGHSEAQCFPKKKTNPKCFIVIEGDLKKLGNSRYMITAKDKRPAMGGKLGRLKTNSSRASWFSG